MSSFALTPTSITLDGKPCHLGARVELWAEREVIDVSSATPLYGPDPDWTYVDAHGHFHAWSAEWSNGEEPSWILPTLEQREVQLAYVLDGDGGEGDEWTERRWFCRVCDEQVEPGTKVEESSRTTKTLIPGRKTWGVRGVIVPVEHFDHIGSRVIRIADNSAEFWGVVLAPDQWDSGDGYVRVDLIGSGPLGRRLIR